MNEELDEVERLINEAVAAKASAAKARAPFERALNEKAQMRAIEAYRRLNMVQKWITENRNGADPTKPRRHELVRRLIDEVFEAPKGSRA